MGSGGRRCSSQPRRGRGQLPWRLSWPAQQVRPCCVLNIVLLTPFLPPSLPPSLTHSLTPSLTNSPTCTHSLTQSLTRSLTHSLTHPLAHSLTHLLTHPPTYSPTHSLTHSLTHPPSLTHSLAHSLTHFLFPSLTYSLPPSFTRSLPHFLPSSLPHSLTLPLHRSSFHSCVLHFPYSLILTSRHIFSPSSLPGSVLQHYEAELQRLRSDYAGLSGSKREMMERLLMGGDLLEVTLDEVQQLWQCLQCDTEYLSSFETSPAKVGRTLVKEEVRYVRNFLLCGCFSICACVCACML